ncbi:hypothetical protein BY996DRAFT_6622959 [Phakopsora pachyrhizi]|nr:hypothetical protein BY996DRAFT_6622959 [Phakopsora pachyrhizi]
MIKRDSEEEGLIGLERPVIAQFCANNPDTLLRASNLLIACGLEDWKKIRSAVKIGHRHKIPVFGNGNVLIGEDRFRWCHDCRRKPLQSSYLDTAKREIYLKLQRECTRAIREWEGWSRSAGKSHPGGMIGASYQMLVEELDALNMNHWAELDELESYNNSHEYCLVLVSVAAVTKAISATYPDGFKDCWSSYVITKFISRTIKSLLKIIKGLIAEKEDLPTVGAQIDGYIKDWQHLLLLKINNNNNNKKKESKNNKKKKKKNNKK